MVSVSSELLGGKSGTSQSNNGGATRILSPLNEYFLVLCQPRLGLLEMELAYCFESVSGLLYARMLQGNGYFYTQCVVKANKIFIQMPTCPDAHVLFCMHSWVIPISLKTT